MKKITVYKTLKQASSSLDNGGRFFNILTKSNDGVISEAELGKVAGLFSDKQKMVLYFDMATSALGDDAKAALVSTMDGFLLNSYKRYKAQDMIPSEAKTNASMASNVIVKGIPKLIDARSEFTGFIHVPITTNNVTTFVLIPIIDTYDVYELRDDESSEAMLVAHARSRYKLPEKTVTLGGIIKQLKASKNSEDQSKKFLEIVYFLDNE